MDSRTTDDEEEILTSEPEDGISEQAPPSEDSKSETPHRHKGDNDLITLSDEEKAVTAEASESAKWNFLAGAAHKHRMLTGVVSGLESIGSGNYVSVVDYKGVRILIPDHEMILAEWPDNERAPLHVIVRLNGLLGAKVDFVPMAVDMRNRAAVASRKAAMLENQKRYYASGRVQPGIRVACRIVKNGDKALTVEALGVESVIQLGEIAHEWIDDIAAKYPVGDLVVARVLDVVQSKRTGLYSVKLSIKAAHEDPGIDQLNKLVMKSCYFGTVTGVHDTTIYIRLHTGCNAATRMFRTMETPSKHDTVSFQVRGIDREHGVALGVVTRIIKRHSQLQ